MGGEPKKLSASPPLHLGDLYSTLQAESDARLKGRADPASLFADSLSYELKRSLRAAQQIIGAEAGAGEQLEPQPAPDSLGQHAQMLGRAVGGLLPTLAIAAGTRYGFGKILAHEGQVAEQLLLKRTTVGLSLAESATTGFVSGAVFTPTDGARSKTPPVLLSIASEVVPPLDWRLR